MQTQLNTIRMAVCFFSKCLCFFSPLSASFLPALLNGWQARGSPLLRWPAPSITCHQYGLEQRSMEQPSSLKYSKGRQRLCLIIVRPLRSSAVFWCVQECEYSVPALLFESGYVLCYQSLGLLIAILCCFHCKPLQLFHLLKIISLLFIMTSNQAWTERSLLPIILLLQFKDSYSDTK